MEYRIGIDLGGTAIKMGVVDENYNVLFKRSLPTAESFERAAGDMADCAERLAGEAGLELRRFRCAGMGVTGGINKQGLLIYSGNTTWADVSLKREMEKHFPIPVYIGNDADCALIGESLAGAAKGYKNIVMLTLGTGVGGGIIIDGRLYSGDEYMSTEPGHFPLFHDGLSCGCGSRGCLETYASASALVRQAEEAMTEHPESSLCGAERACGGLDGRIIFECARQGDETALAVID
ncbi:MAG: ROK family protein, partial [Candidatus Limivicinus sp.]